MQAKCMRGVLAGLVLGAALPLFTTNSPAFAQGMPAMDSFAELAEKTRRSVVTVGAATVDKTKRAGVGDAKSDEDGGSVGDFSLGAPRQKKGTLLRRYSSVGSGFVIDSAGFVVTNNHVIEGGEEIYVIFSDGSELKVDKVIGRDAKTDLALLKVTPAANRPLSAVAFGNSTTLRIGDWVVAVGNPFGLKGTVTAGILSGKGRDISAGPYDEFLQTDAAINKGNSGGPLFNAAGEVIGINTAIFSPSGGSIGIGFAIPSNTAKRVVEQLKTYGEPRFSFAGMRLQSVNEDLSQNLGLSKPEGALVARIERGGPADVAGLREGDVIVGFAGSVVHAAKDVSRMVARTDAGSESTVDFVRDRERRSLTLITSIYNDKTLGKLAAPTAPTPPRRQRAARQ